MPSNFSNDECCEPYLIFCSLKTDANGNTILHSVVSEVLIRTNSWKYYRTVDVGKTAFWGGDLFPVFFARRNLVLHVVNCQHVIKKQLMRRQTFDLGIQSTHRRPASCQSRPVNVDDGLEDIRWIHCI